MEDLSELRSLVMELKVLVAQARTMGLGGTGMPAGAMAGTVASTPAAERRSLPNPALVGGAAAGISARLALGQDPGFIAVATAIKGMPAKGVARTAELLGTMGIRASPSQVATLGEAWGAATPPPWWAPMKSGDLVSRGMLRPIRLAGLAYEGAQALTGEKKWDEVLKASAHWASLGAYHSLMTKGLAENTAVNILAGRPVEDALGLSNAWTATRRMGVATGMQAFRATRGYSIGMGLAAGAIIMRGVEALPTAIGAVGALMGYGVPADMQQAYQNQAQVVTAAQGMRDIGGSGGGTSLGAVVRDMVQREKLNDWKGRDSTWARYILQGAGLGKSEDEMRAGASEQLLKDLQKAHEGYQEGIKELSLGNVADAQGKMAKAGHLAHGTLDYLDAASMYSSLMASTESSKNYARSQMSRADSRSGD